MAPRTRAVQQELPLGQDRTSRQAQTQDAALRQVQEEGPSPASEPAVVMQQEAAPEPVLPDFETTVQNWIDANVTPGSPVTYKIYKDKGKAGPWPWCADYSDRPEFEEVGRRFGGGRFQLRLVSTDPNTQEQRVSGTYIFELDESYNELHKLAVQETENALVQQRAAAARAAQPPMPQMAGGMDPTAALNASINLLGTMMDKVVAPLLKAREPVPQTDPTGVFALMTQQAASMSKMFLQNTIDNAKAITDTVMELREQYDEEPDDDGQGEAAQQQEQLPAVQQEPQPDIVDYLCGLAEQYGPAIVGENTAASKILITLVKSAPLWKKLLAQPSDFSKVLAGLDAKMGEAKVNQFLNALGVSRP